MKTVKEIAVRLENKPGVLSQVSELLGANGINILALTVQAEGSEGILSFVATNPARVTNVLESAGLKPEIREILAAEAPHHPGGLNALLKPLKLAGVNVRYLYSCISFHGAGDRTIILLGVDNIQAAHDALSKEWIKLYGEELYNF
ncbi:ACT domain-containing protein [Desulfomonile tiedjei]|uniref:ACT domain-containing protein n=1 Tax=Desulfomonile tiedjei (strain ATCC 49306 / DSM 6799 / DCB-1) TaxID=706587 RepID=I4C810_DESTA|nr:ACT domain-containing protein [Desulfomonile tiedjei]AFM25701.1 ACT domain-containing protein [Desulfomonile tiedjei DSM 6799]